MALGKGVIRDGVSRMARINARAVFVIFALSLIAGHAGGLGIAPLMAIAGGFSLAALLMLRDDFIVPIEPWVIALSAFLAWAFISSFWSPYDGKGLPNAVKLGIGVTLFWLGARGFARAGRDAPKRAVSVLMWGVLTAALILVLDVVTGYGLSFLVDPVRASEDPVSRLGDAQMNVGHGITVLNVLLAPMIAAALWTHARGHWISIAAMALLVIGAVLGDLIVGVLAVIASVLAMAAAYRWPQKTISALTFLMMGLIGFAPLMGACVGALPQSVRDALPFSWEHRIVTWSYTAAQTRDAPLLGHGFDAARTFDSTFSARGYDGIAKISLHPHNAGLHIWLETGIIGAILAVITVLMLGRKAQNYALGGPPRAMAVAGFMVAAMLISTVTYGVWQDWWWASLALAIGVLMWVPRTQR